MYRKVTEQPMDLIWGGSTDLNPNTACVLFLYSSILLLTILCCQYGILILGSCAYICL